MNTPATITAVLGIALVGFWSFLPMAQKWPGASIVTVVALGAALSAAIATASIINRGQGGAIVAEAPAGTAVDHMPTPAGDEPRPVSHDHPIPDVVFSGPRDIDRIALVFDDGPDDEHTDELLAVLAEYDAKATFAMLGERVRRYPQVAQRVVEAGHLVASHGETHRAFTKLSGPELEAELSGTEEAIIAVGGKSPRWVRPPYGATSDAVNQLVAARGGRVLLWDVDPSDWRPGKTPDEVAADVILTVRPGSILVLHDTRATTVEATRIILHGLSHRFAFVTVNELFAPSSSSSSMTNR